MKKLRTKIFTEEKIGKPLSVYGQLTDDFRQTKTDTPSLHDSDEWV